MTPKLGSFGSLVTCRGIVAAAEKTGILASQVDHVVQDMWQCHVGERQTWTRKFAVLGQIRDYRSVRGAITGSIRGQDIAVPTVGQPAD